MKNLVFMGTHVAQGFGKGVVIAIGHETEFGRTAKMMSVKEDESDFQKGVNSFGLMLFKIIIVFSLSILASSASPPLIGLSEYFGNIIALLGQTLAHAGQFVLQFAGF